jgi:hypothetical protein
MHLGSWQTRRQSRSASQPDTLVTRENWQAHARMTRGMAARLERWGDIKQARLLFRLAWEQERQAEFRAEHGTVLAFPQRGADLSETRWKPASVGLLSFTACPER